MSVLQFLQQSLSFSSSESNRSQALTRGLPAFLIAVAAFSAIAWANFGQKEQLEQEYSDRFADSKKAKQKLVKDLQTEIRILQASRRSSGGSDEPLIPKDDERIVELNKVRNEERVYLEKLINLNPEEFDYRYELALVSFEQRDLQRGMALMQQAAPVEEPRFAKAHLWLAKYYLGLKPNSVPEQRRNQALALKHAEHSLTRGLEAELDEKSAKVIKAKMLYAGGREEPAYEIFQELFVDDVAFYKPLTQINQRIGREDRNELILDTAISEYYGQLKEDGLSIEAWVTAWGNVFDCLKETKDYKRAEKMLADELQIQVDSGQSPEKQKFLEQMLSSLYYAWSMSLPAEQNNKRLELLKLAYRYNPISSLVMTELTRFATGSDEQLAEVARQVYDPADDTNAPPSVLNALGSQALAKEEFDNAIRYYELARKKSPRNAAILNNLAYAYLVCENKNPERALKLVNEAIRSLQNNRDVKVARSNFFDTRGTALMQLNRMTEAAAAFEIALKDRPNNRKILESLVKCYEQNNLSPGVYLERLKKLDEEQANDSSTDGPADGN